VLTTLRKFKVFSLFLVLAVLVAACPAGAVEDSTIKAKFKIGAKSYYSARQVFPMDVAPFIESGRTFVPVRFLAYAVGVPEDGVSWDAATRTVRLENRGVAVTLRLRETVLRRNGSPVQMDVAPVLRQNRVFLPARFVAEAFGCAVAWDGAARAVYVYPVKIDWEAAKKGTLQPPEDAKQPPDVWGFAPKAVRMEFEVGSRYAKVTRADGSTYTLDLGTPCVVMLSKNGSYPPFGNAQAFKKFLIQQYGKVVGYNENNVVISVAKAFGVPKENIVWDGKHLAVFGFDGSTRGYIALRAGSKETIWRWVTTTDEVIYSSKT